MGKVLLLSMPMGALERPSLGLSLLKPRLAEEGIPCDVRYLAFAFAEFIGHDDYQWLCYGLPYTAFAGDWSFTASLYGERPTAECAYIEQILRGTWRLTDREVARVLRARAMVPHFLEHCMAAVPWRNYAIVGFTSTFEQNIASLSLAKRLKATHPRLATVFGGANWEADMGHELHRRFPFVDYVCSGESEQSFPALARRVLAGERLDAAGTAPIPGVVYRSRAGESVYTGPAEGVREMDDLPYPDYGDYFRDLDRCTVSSPVVPTLLFETSRGCWWGAKSHCTFCGLNGGSMAFRSKSPRRALEELEHLTARWQTDSVEAVDNILDMRYFDDMLPALAAAGRPARLFYEVKANLTREQVRLLSEAGVARIQPGIESLSDHVLRLMRKGTTGLRNIQLLKWAQEHEVIVEWNILYGFPGETREDYRHTLELLRSIRFLRPPCATGPIRLDRFSPYYNAPSDFGLTNVRPLATYRHLYPFDEASLMRVAYYFDFDYEPGVNPTGYAAEVVAFAEEWKRTPEGGTLRAVERSGGALTLLDTRAGATAPELILAGPERTAYEFCDELHTAVGVLRHLRNVFPGAEFDERSIVVFLDSLVAHRLMVTDGRNYLSLALRVPVVRPGSGHEARRGAPLPASSYLRPKLKVLRA
jgi:ribosomal peptide maturation radical SAM protein 1